MSTRVGMGFWVAWFSKWKLWRLAVKKFSAAESEEKCIFVSREKKARFLFCGFRFGQLPRLSFVIRPDVFFCLCLGISREILIVRQSRDKKKKYQIHNLFGIVIIKNLIHIFFTFHPELKISQQLNLIYSFLTIVLLKIKEFNFLT